MTDTQHYWKRKLVNQNIEVEYSSETDEITIRIDHRLKNGSSIGRDYMVIHPSYIEPLYKLLKDVVADSPTPLKGTADNE